MKKMFYALCIIASVCFNNVIHGMELLDITVDLSDIERTFATKKDPHGRIVHHIWLASAKGDIDIVLKTIAYKKQYIHDATSDNITPLWMASQNGHSDIVKILIQAGADVNKTREDGMSALSMATMKGHINVAELLLATNANIQQADNQGITPLIMAAICGHGEILSLLINAHADIHKPVTSGDSALILAVEHGHLHIVDILINAGADVNYATESGITPLLMASINNKIQIAELLLKKGAKKSINAVYQGTKVPNKMNSLYAAAANGHSKIILLLLEAGADTTWENEIGETALEIAQKNLTEHKKSKTTSAIEQKNRYTECVQLLKYAKTTAK